MSTLVRHRARTVAQAMESCADWDVYLFDLLSPKKNRFAPDRLFYWLSRSADGPAYLAGILALILIRYPAAAPLAVAMMAGFAIELPLYKSLKALFKRRRPCVSIPGVTCSVAPPDYYSFPSGHTAGAFLMAALLRVCLPSVTLAAYLWAAAVGYSRVYNRVHYPADVLAGAALGHACALAALFLTM